MVRLQSIKDKHSFIRKGNIVVNHSRDVVPGGSPGVDVRELVVVFGVEGPEGVVVAD